MKKLISLALCLLLLCGCLGACGKDDKSKQKETEVTTPEEYQIDLENHLTNPNATKEAIAVYNFIRDMSGKYIISGQQESPSSNATEMNEIFSATGKTAALKGLDFINDDFEGVTRRAITWWELGGLVSICWHMGTPPDGVGYDSSKGRIDLEASLTEGTEEYNNLIAEFDKAVPYLKELQDAGVPVLWRPFHESDGGWFWWSKGGKDAFIELWKLMYTYYTEECGLNNLIWVCGFSDQIAQHLDWYPGDEYVDIFGADIYASTNNSQKALYDYCYKVVGDRKPICLHENGPIPDPDKLKEEGVKWSWFMTWHSEWLDQNEDEYLNKVYNHDYVITVQRMPKIAEQIAKEK
ncbi:MAG: glycosyl hydrolase [Lachnospiraceae bacterium]|nr:glycosyl hydrolase [Lachnospiraceae bacterium]